MPTYDYRCNTCENEFEIFQSMSAEAKANCPECGADATRLISGGAGIIFKGSGFYVNDYKAKTPESNTASCASNSGAEACKTCPNASAE